MTDSPRVAVIGAGRWGRNLIRNFHALGALAAVCDADEATLAEHRERLPGVAATGAAETLLADADIDAIAVATPSLTHEALARASLAAGKSVFVEKPLCTDPEAARALAAAAAAAGLTLMVGHLLRYHPAFVALHELLIRGGLGELRYVGAQRLNFRAQRSQDDALWDIAPHEVSMILALGGSLPRQVSASGAATVTPATLDTLHASLGFGDGLQASLAASWIHPYKEQRLVVAGTEGVAVFDDLQPGHRKLVHQRQRRAAGRSDLLLREEAEPIAYEAGEPLARECRHFLDCLRSGAAPATGPAEAIAVIQVLAACERSAREHRPVDPRGL